MHRLDRILANRGYCPRSQAKAFLRDNDVRRDEERLMDPSMKLDSAGLSINAQPIDPETLIILLHKPAGYVCSHREQGMLVYDLLPQRWRMRNPSLSTVGRLDKDTSGVLLITDDGKLLHRLTSPKYHVPRIYLATVDRPLRGNEADIFRSGTLMLENEAKPLLPAEMELIDPTHARLTLHEGRYHQVRRMFAAVGNHVTALHRERFGKLGVADLSPGSHRLLTETELLASLGGI